MPKQTDTLVAGQYFLAVEGLALIRTTLTDPSAGRARVEEIRGIVERFDEFPNSLEIPMTEYDVDEGYSVWAHRYDGPNPAIDGLTIVGCEEPRMTEELLVGLPSYLALPEATRQAFAGLPFLLIWDLRRA